MAGLALVKPGLAAPAPLRTLQPVQHEHAARPAHADGVGRTRRIRARPDPLSHERRSGPRSSAWRQAGAPAQAINRPTLAGDAGLSRDRVIRLGQAAGHFGQRRQKSRCGGMQSASVAGGWCLHEVVPTTATVWRIDAGNRGHPPHHLSSGRSDRRGGRRLSSMRLDPAPAKGGPTDQVGLEIERVRSRRGWRGTSGPSAGT